MQAVTTIIRAETGKEADALRSAREHGLDLIYPTKTVEVRKKRWDRIMQRFKLARRPVVEDHPVLPGYMFAAIQDHDFHKLALVKHIYRDVIHVTNSRDADDIDRFLFRVDRGDFNHDGAFGDLQPGRVMQLVGGLFDRMLVSFKARSGDMVRVEADMMGRKVQMEVSVDEVDVVE